eukprot:11169093-Lingulodinium_polyedra.AAC.1
MRALRVHMHKAHGARHRARGLIASTHCPVCMMQHWTRARVLHHLVTGSLLCLHTLEQASLRPKEQDVRDAEAEEA